MSAVAFAASLAMVAFFIGDDQVRCGLNPSIISFYVAVAAISIAAIVKLDAIRGLHLNKSSKVAAPFLLTLPIVWVWWLGPQCAFISR